MHVDGQLVDVQYSNWASNVDLYQHNCVVATNNNYWFPFACSDQQRYVCQG